MASQRQITFLISANTDAFTKGLNSAQAKLRNFGRRMERIGRSMTMSVTAPIAAAGAASVKMASDFESSMTRIETLVGLSRDEVQGMRKDVLSLSRETGRGPRELSEALFSVTSAGLRGQQAMQTLEMSAKAAAIGLGQTRDISKALTGILQSYSEQGLGAAEATNTLIEIVRQGNLEASELAPVLGRVTGIASQLGISFGQVGASIASFTRLGVSAEEAVTGLRGIMNALLKQTPKAEKALDSVGLTFDGLRKKIQQEGLAQALVDLVDSFEGNQQGLAEFAGRVRGLSAIMGTAGAQSQSYLNIAQKIQGQNENLSKGFDRVSETVRQKFNKALSSLKVSAINLGNTLIPIATRLIESVNNAVSAFDSLSKSTQQFYVKIALIAASIGPVIWGLGQMAIATSALIGGFKTLISVLITLGKGILAGVVTGSVTKFTAALRLARIKGIIPLTKAIGKSIAAFALATLKVTSIIAIIGGLVLVAKSVWDAWGTVSTFFANLWDKIVIIFAKGVRASSQMMQDLFGFVPGMGDMFDGLTESMNNMEKRANKRIEARGVVSFGETVGAVWDKMKDNASQSVEFVKDQFQNVSDFAMGLIPSFDFSSGMGKDKEKAKKESDRIGVDIPSINQQLGDINTQKYVDSLKKIRKATSNFKSSTKAALTDTRSFWQKFSDGVESVTQNLSKRIKDMVGKMFGDMATTLGSSVGKALAGVEDSFTTSFEKIMLIFLDFAKQLASIIGAIGGALLFVPGMQGTAAAMLAAAAVLSGVATGFKSGINKRAENRRKRAQGNGGPGMASGGIVPEGFPNDTYPAMLSSGETVVPSPKDLPSDMGGRNINLSGEFRIKGTDLVMTLEQAQQTLR